MSVIPILLLLLPLCAGLSLNEIWEWTSILSLWKNADFEDTSAGREKRQADTGLGYVPDCKDGYEKVSGSTMCLVDSPNYIPNSAGISEADKEIILKEHNEYRAAVHPPAKSMRKLYWDDELAKLAEKWAKQCIVGHDLGNGRLIPKYDIIPGQNGGYQMENWEAVIGAWFSERELFRYGEDPEIYLGHNGWLKIGHYAMMAVDTVALIGCGYAKCNTGAQDYYFCNYIPGPTLIPFPYRIGLPCDKCTNNCSRNLCDCGPTYCFHGELDLATCKCHCDFPYRGSNCLIDPCTGRRCSHDGILNTETCTCSCPYPYSGELCEQLSCDYRPDADACASLSKDYCVFKSIEKVCPMLCEICPDFCPGLDCENGRPNISTCECLYPCGSKECLHYGKLSLDSCNCTCKYPFTGDSCDIKNCTGKLDPDFCEIYWPKYLCNFWPVEKYCPVMCDVCPGPCPHISCQNNGITTKDCTCRCHYPYTGAECETKNCTNKKDRAECRTRWPHTYCSRFSNIRVYCPNMCGTCPEVCGGKECQNNGVLDANTCECACHQNFTGEFCEREKCGGKKCLNYGNLDFGTCYCHCPPNHTGDTCEVWSCPTEDPVDCGTSDMPFYQCFTHWDVPFICPYLCSLCKTVEG